MSAHKSVHPTATWGKRFLGYLVDLVVILSPVILVILGLSAVTLFTATAPDVALWFMLMSSALAASALLYLWDRVWLQGRTGQSLGKRYAHSAVVAEGTRTPIGAGKSFLRDIAKLVDTAAIFLGWFAPLWSPTNQTFSDRLLHTDVLDITRMTSKEFAGTPAPRWLIWIFDLGWRHAVGVGAVIFALFPILYVISSSLNPHGTLLGSNKLFPTVSFENYVKLFHDPRYPFADWFWNSMQIGIITSVLTVFLGALAAYAFSRMRFYGRRPGLLALILVQMFPQMLAFVAIFLLLTGIGEVFPFMGIGSKTGLIMVYLGGALGVNTYLMYGFFNTVPQSLDEAARVDGAGHARIFFTIILRLVAPILAVTALLSFIGSMNDYVLPRVILTDVHDWTLPVGMPQMVGGQLKNENWPIFAAGAVISAMPVLALFFALQKYIVGGLTAGAVK